MTDGARISSASWWRQMPVAAWLFLFGVWVLLSGKFDAFHLGTGLAAVAFVAWLHGRLPATPEPGAPGLRSLRVPFFGLWLFWQMIQSAVYVGRVILNPGRHLDPHLIAFRSKQPSLLSHVIFANSISLTPGTLTAELEGDRYLVHALTPRTAADTLSGHMAARVARLSSDEPIGLPESFPPEEMSHLS